MSSHLPATVPPAPGGGEDGATGDLVLAPAAPPGTERLVADLREEVSRLIVAELERLADALAPDSDGAGRRRPGGRPVDRVVASLDLADAVRAAVHDAAGDAVRAAVAATCDRLADALEGHAAVADGVAVLSVAVDVTGTHAWETVRRRTARAGAFVEERVRRQLRDLLRGVADGDLAATVRGRAAEIGDDYGRVLSGLEIPQARRDGVAAVAEAADVVAATRWRASDDCPHAWHARMDGTVVDCGDPFVVPAVEGGDQPGAYPRAVFAVGADEPFGCRCAQDLVLAADVPTDVRELRGWDGVDVDCRVTDRQYGVWLDHARDGEDFAALLARIDAEYSRTRAAETFCNGSKKQLYGWLAEYGLK
ncbi:hypothetical protein [Salinilacihabitans rarus]|uniref:hypothetical protein n=1 Tax=Salinilacihabitans rarus TaxID=2961596 RepID=UPI0020C86F67|nr:hypothetical protein [Salinilacihabitans rarus]